MFLFSLYYVDIFGRLFDTGGSHYLLRKYYNQPIAHNIRFNDILKGLVSENTQKVDMMFTQTVGKQHNQCKNFFGQHQR